MIKENISIEPLQTKDFLSLHRMYSNMPDEDKRFFQPGFLGFKNIDIPWLIRQLCLGISTNVFLRQIAMEFYCRSIFLSIAAINENKEIVGFSYIKIKNKTKKGLQGILGIIIRQDYQGKGLGKQMLKDIISLGKENKVTQISLTVLSENIKAISLYKNSGFRSIGVIERYRYLDGEWHTGLEMVYKEDNESHGKN